MRRRWRTLLLLLLVVELAIGYTIVRIQPRCEPCLPGVPCPPCVSSDQLRLLMIGGLLPVGVVLAQLIVTLRARRKA
ncbi:MAG: hypothetical protein JNL05_10915 [Flavobacteriales bacterium]|nr:hypothetical protein [Flavobacteriales bacterium]